MPPLQPPQRGALAALGVLRAIRGARQPREYRVVYSVRRMTMRPQSAQPDPASVSLIVLHAQCLRLQPRLSAAARAAGIGTSAIS